MSSGLEELYQELILDHGKRPRNQGPLDGHTHHAEGYNPLCGDHVHVYLLMDGDTVQDIRFDGSGCAICIASASMMTRAIKGASRDAAEQMFRWFKSLLTEKSARDDTRANDALGELTALGGVRRFPMRVKCATLPWHTLHAAIEGRGQPVSTES